MNIQDAINGYKNKTRPLLLSYELTPDRIALVYKIDQAAAAAEIISRQETPFSTEITSESIDLIYDEADEMEDRFRDEWKYRVSQLTLLFNYCK